MLVAGILHRHRTGGATVKDGEVGDVVQVVVPTEYKKALKQLSHEGHLASHLKRLSRGRGFPLVVLYGREGTLICQEVRGAILPR